MPNPIKQRPLEPILAEIAQAGFSPTGPFAIAIRDMLTRSDKTQTNLGEIKEQANVTGRTEQIGTTLQNVEATGEFNSLGNVVDTSTDHLTDGAGSPLTGGKRGFIALDVNSRLLNSFRQNPLNTSNAPTSSSTLSNDGIHTTINLSAFTNNYGAGAVGYNSASFDPGSFNTWYIFTDDSTFAGGATTPFASLNSSDQTSRDSIVPIGKIASANATPKTGGGFSGGDTVGGAGGRGYVQ